MTELARATRLIDDVIENYCVTDRMPQEIAYASLILARACLARISGKAGRDADVSFFETNLKVVMELFAEGNRS